MALQLSVATQSKWCSLVAAVVAVEELEAAAERLLKEEAPSIEVYGKELGEKLTHVLLATRIRARLDRGQGLREAYRAVMGEVRGVLSNE